MQFLKYKICAYRQTSSLKRTKSKNVNVSRLALQLSLPNSLKQGVKSRMKMELELCWQTMLQLHLSDQQVYCIPRRDLY